MGEHKPAGRDPSSLPAAVLQGGHLRLEGELEEAQRIFDGGCFGKCPSLRGRPQEEEGGGGVEGDPKRRRVGGGGTPPHGWLQLTLEEGYYLAFVLGRIRVLRAEGGELAAEEAWGLFCAGQLSFPTSYKAYRHFRTEGWVPRAGIKYGIQHLLYPSATLAASAAAKDHPHSPFAVLVRGEEELTWRDVQSSSRLAWQVSKQLLVALVEGDGPEGGGGPGGQGDVCEVVLDRWEPERARDSRAK